MPFQAQAEASRGCQCTPAGLEQAEVPFPQASPVHSNLRQFAHRSEPQECSPCESAFQWHFICHLPSFSGHSERDAFLFRLNQIFINAAASGTAGLRQHFLPKMPFLGSPGSLQLLPLKLPFPASASEQMWGGQNRVWNTRKGWKGLVTMMENSLLLRHELPGTPDRRVGVGLGRHGDRTAPEMFPLAEHESLCQGGTWILG